MRWPRSRHAPGGARVRLAGGPAGRPRGGARALPVWLSDWPASAAPFVAPAPRSAASPVAAHRRQRGRAARDRPGAGRRAGRTGRVAAVVAADVRRRRGSRGVRARVARRARRPRRCRASSPCCAPGLARHRFGSTARSSSALRRCCGFVCFRLALSRCGRTATTRPARSTRGSGAASRERMRGRLAIRRRRRGRGCRRDDRGRRTGGSDAHGWPAVRSRRARWLRRSAPRRRARHARRPAAARGRRRLARLP